MIYNTLKENQDKQVELNLVEYAAVCSLIPDAGHETATSAFVKIALSELREDGEQWFFEDIETKKKANADLANVKLTMPFRAWVASIFYIDRAFKMLGPCILELLPPDLFTNKSAQDLMLEDSKAMMAAFDAAFAKEQENG